MSKQVIILEEKEIGKNEFWEIRDILSNFVRSNFKLLYEGAVRLGFNIEEDYYAPRRIQINGTRLHKYTDLKYADGHKYNEDSAPTEAQLRKTIEDIQALIDAGSKDVEATFKLQIVEKPDDSKIRGFSK